MIELNGQYNGKNLYVKNPFCDHGFCVLSVYVNDRLATDEMGVSALEIDLRNFDLRPGDAVKVIISHKDGCTPTVLNPEALSPEARLK